MNPRNQSEEELLCNMNFGTRDAGRRPMSWDDSENSGFGGKPWLPVYNRYKEINVQADLMSDKSVYNYYQKLLNLRKENEAFITGTYENITEDRKGVYIYKRYTDDECYIVVCNFENSNEIRLNFDCKLVLTNCEQRDISGTYQPYECAVFKLNE
jgi:glycosidase